MTKSYPGVGNPADMGFGKDNAAENAALLIHRVFNEGNLDQYKRELVVNAFQAGATEVRYTGLRLADFGLEGGVKLAVVDNGVGMASGKIGHYIGELFNGASALGPDGNFQMGARVSTLPLSPEGIMVASWTEEEPEGSLIHIYYNEDTKTYRKVPYPIFDDYGSQVGETYVGIPDPYLKHPIIQEAGHGTVFVLLGARAEDHTVGEIRRDPKTQEFVYPTERVQKEDVLTFNAKFYELPAAVRKGIAIPQGPADLETWKRYIAPGQWFESAVDRERTEGDYHFGWRHATGGKSRIDLAKEMVRKRGLEVYSGIVDVVSREGLRAKVHWSLFPEEHYTRTAGGTSDDRDYFIPLGLFGELYRHAETTEVYNIHKWRATRYKMEYYGIPRSEVRDRLVVLVEPEKESTSVYGALPSSSRRQLMIANAELPHDEWGADFARKMPEPIRKRLRDLDGTRSGGDEKAQKRMLKDLARFFQRARKRSDGDMNLPVGDLEPEGDNANPKKEGTDSPPRGSSAKKSGRKIAPIGGTGRKRSSAPGDVKTNVILPQIEVIWESKMFAEDDEKRALPVYRNLDKVYVNESHPVVKTLIEEAVKERDPGQSDRVRKLAREAIENHLIAAVLSVRLYQSSAATWPDEVFGISNSFVATAESSEALSGHLLHVLGMKRVINGAMNGKAGLKRLFDSDTEDSDEAAA